MGSDYWQKVQSTGFEVPTDRPLSDLTAELTEMLGSPDAAVRDGTAQAALARWITSGVYDDLLGALGDGMIAGLHNGIGDVGTDTVFRRSLSARTLAACVDRDNQHHLLPGAKGLEWGDHLVTWFLRERDTRDHVEGKGWVRAIVHGADALGALARSPHFTANELTVILDVIADRVLMPDQPPLLCGEPDRMALAVMSVLRRNVVRLSVLEPWIVRVASHAGAGLDRDEDPHRSSINPQSFLRALFIQLSLAPEPPQVRTDLLLTIIDALRATNPDCLRQAPSGR